MRINRCPKNEITQKKLYIKKTTGWEKKGSNEKNFIKNIPNASYEFPDERGGTFKGHRMKEC